MERQGYEKIVSTKVTCLEIKIFLVLGYRQGNPLCLFESQEYTRERLGRELIFGNILQNRIMQASKNFYKLQVRRDNHAKHCKMIFHSKQQVKVYDLQGKQQFVGPLPKNEACKLEKEDFE